MPSVRNYKERKREQAVQHVCHVAAAHRVHHEEQSDHVHLPQKRRLYAQNNRVCNTAPPQTTRIHTQYVGITLRNLRN